jgi:hypothetical protein
MAKFLNTLSKILSFPVALIFTLILPICILIFNLGNVVFDRPLVKGIVTDEVVNSDLIPAGLAWFSEDRADERVITGEARPNVDEPDIVQMLTFVDITDWRGIKTEVLTPEILTEWSSVTVDGTYDWIDTSDRVPQIAFDLTAFKARVATEHGLNALTIVYNALPPCEQHQIDDFVARLAAAPPGAEVLYNLCQFPDPWFEDQFSDYHESLLTVVANILNPFELTQNLAESADNPEGVGPEALKAQLILIRKYYRLVPLIAAALLVLLLLLGVRTVVSLGRWWGVPLTLGGFLTLLPPLVYRYAITWFLANGPLSEVPQLIMEEATRSLLRLAAEVFRPMLWQAAAIMFVGLALAVWGSIENRKRNNASSEAPPAE